MSTLLEWKEYQEASDEDILTPEYLNRVLSQPPVQKSEIVYCVCGCGGFWLRPVGHVGKKQRHIRGHAPKRRPPLTREEMIARSDSLHKWILEKGSSRDWPGIYDNKWIPEEDS